MGGCRNISAHKIKFEQLVDSYKIYDAKFDKAIMCIPVDSTRSAERYLKRSGEIIKSIDSVCELMYP